MEPTDEAKCSKKELYGLAEGLPGYKALTLNYNFNSGFYKNFRLLFNIWIF